MSSTCLIWVCIFVHVSVRAFVHSSSASICQSEMNHHKNMCYWVETTIANFDRSQQMCGEKGGNLATIDSQETSLFLKDFVKDDEITIGDIWIGYDERSQAWIDGTLFSWLNYLKGYPMNNTDYCTALISGKNYGWVNADCSSSNRGLCQIQVPPASRQFDFVVVDEGSTVSVSDEVVVVQTASRVSCGVQCGHDEDCFVFRYTKADKTCTLYNTGTIIITVTSKGEWYEY